MEVLAIDNILDFAIGHEHKAVAYYSDMAMRMTSDELHSVFERLCSEERMHVQVLEQMREHGTSLGNTFIDVADAVKECPPGAELAVEAALKLAASREKAAFKLYFGLSQNAPDTTSKRIFLELARQEACHKLQIELVLDSQFRSLSEMDSVWS